MATYIADYRIEASGFLVDMGQLIVGAKDIADVPPIVVQEVRVAPGQKLVVELVKKMDRR